MLIEKLNGYISTRKKERELTGKPYLHYFFCIGLGDRADIKISAAEKLLRARSENITIKFDDSEIEALSKKRLGEIVSAHGDELPKCFVQQKTAYLKKQFDNSMMIAWLHPGTP